MIEWFKVLVLKTSVFQSTVGSNPTLSVLTFNFLNMYFFKQVSHYQGSINTNNEYKDKSFKFLHNESELRRKVQQALSIKNHHMESIIIPIIGSSTYEVPNLAWTVSSFPHSLGISAGSYEYDQILDEAIRYSQYRELQANL